ncbi:MAG: GNAT family N-acetyltransferase [Bacteroidales bacterium]
MDPIALDNALGCLRPFRADDALAVAAYANNPKIALNLRDMFPHPYALGDAERFISMVTGERRPSVLAIDVNGAAIGCIGLRLQEDVERVSAELGYWLAEPFWGRGITTAAVRAMVAYAMPAFGLTRIFALPYAHNTASARVLEKAGFRLEARLRRAVIKDGVVLDQLQYAINDDHKG